MLPCSGAAFFHLAVARDVNGIGQTSENAMLDHAGRRAEQGIQHCAIDAAIEMHIEHEAAVGSDGETVFGRILT